MKISEVYNAGGQPTVTFVHRTEDHLDQTLVRHLDSGSRVLCVHGPTKTGKTVGIRTKIPLHSGIWIPSGEISSSDEFWQRVILEIDGYTSIEKTDTESQSTGNTGSAELGLSAGPITAKLGGEREVQKERESGFTSSFQVSANISGPVLLRKAKRPIVLDDFHYLESKTQRAIIRSLKNPIYEGVPVVLIAVPQHAFSAVEAEPEMAGRIESIEIFYWNNEDLGQIATQGFEPLNIWIEPKIVEVLSAQSFNSPFLMQRMCYELCVTNGINETVAGDVKLLKAPRNWEEFFGSIASGMAKRAYDELARGPRQRSDRIRRRTVEGNQCDIYEAVLKAIKRTGPKFELTYEEIRTALREVLASEVPQAHEVTRVLTEMNKIACSERIPGEPVLEYIESRSTLYVTDPFFSFHLKWGT